MKSMKWRVFSVVLAISLVLSLSPSAFASGADGLKTSVQTAVAYAAKYTSAQSIQYALSDGGSVKLSGHVGAYSKTENTPLNDNTLYGIGSISKMYLTAAVMKLSEEGKLQLDTAVTKYLPSFKMADERYKDITVRMLLNHSSGLMGSSMDSAMLFNDSDRSATENLLKKLSNQRLKADPGSYSVYCNDGFTLAELVVEAVSGMSFPDYLQKELLSPSKLNDTFVPGGSFDTARLAKIYSGTDTRALPQECLGTVGTGGIYSTASDLASFGGILTTTSLLGQASLSAMAYPEYKKGIWPIDDIDSLSYGLGWDSVKTYPFCQSGIVALVKGGDTSYYHAGLVVIPQYHLSAAVVSSGGSSLFNELAAMCILIDALSAKGITVDETVPPLPTAQTAIMPVSQQQYAGYYDATTQQMKVDISSDGILSIQSLTYPSSAAQTFSYYSDGSFRDATGKALIRFVTEKNGETYLYQKAFTPISGLGVLPTSNYAAMRVKDGTIGQNAQMAWNSTLTKSFFPVNEKYSSEIYLALSSVTGGNPKLIPGYFGSDRIVDENTALYELQIPGNAGRDGRDNSLSQKNGSTYLTNGTSIYMSGDGVNDIYTGGGSSYSTISQYGYARWYQVGNAAGETMTVSLPEHSGFYVYDANGKITASSVLWGDLTAVLPKDGVLVFSGDAGARFNLRFTA